MNQRRDITIDILRGLAIFTMIGIHTAASVVNQPHPFGLRLYGSFAAPLFILLSGMMVAFGVQEKNYDLKYFLVRGILTIVMGVLVDLLVWNIYPFMTVDVLYLLGLSLPLAYLFHYLNKRIQWGVIILIFIMTLALQKIFGYTNYPSEFYLWGEPSVVVENQTSIFRHWIIDGWFPIFPWLGFSLLGVNLGSLRWKDGVLPTFGKKTVFFIGLGILVLGSLIWWHYPGSLFIRKDCSELFYPPTLGYIISVMGLIVCLFFIVDWKPSVVIYKPLQALGESALLIYILHLALIEHVIGSIWSEKDLQAFLTIYIFLSLLLVGIAYGLRVLRAKWKGRPFIVRFLLGG